MNINPDVYLTVRKKWSKIRKIPYIIFIFSTIILLLESSITKSQRYTEMTYLLLSIFGFILLDYLVSSFLPPYPTNEERIFRTKTMNILVVDPKLDQNIKKKRKFLKLRENLHIEHIAWNELTDEIISDKCIVFLDLQGEIYVSWDFEEEKNHLQNELDRVLRSKGIIIIFAGNLILKKKINPLINSNHPISRIDVTSLLPFIPTKNNYENGGTYIEFNSMTSDIQNLFFIEGKSNFQWFWTLDEKLYKENCKFFAKNFQQEIISGIFFKDKGRVIIIPQSFNNQKIIKTIIERNNVLDEIMNECIEKKGLEISNIFTPTWVNDYKISDEENTLKRIKQEENYLLLIQEIKKLLYSYDDELETSVQKVLGYLGFKEFKTTKDEADLVFFDNDVKFVAEIKGLKRIATPRKINQLYDWLINEGLDQPHKYQVIKGIFICNTERYINPLNRKNSFHPKLIQKAKERRIALISSIELLNIYDKVKQGKISKETIRLAFKEQNGVIEFN